jgi:hypothetical protein
MITNVIWKPFDERFSGLIYAMEEHRKFIFDELEIYQAQQAKDSQRAAAIERERAEKERQRAEEARKQTHDLAGQTEDTKKALNAALKGTLRGVYDV